MPDYSESPSDAQVEGLRILNEAITGKRTAQPWSCWVTYGYDHGPYVDGVYPDELSALRRLNDPSGTGLRAKQVSAGNIDEQLK